MTITAKYPGVCGNCGRSITPGQKIEWAKGSRPTHTTCPAAVAERPAAASKPVATKSSTVDGPIRLSGGSGYGCNGWTVGQVILSGEKRRREGGPDGLVIVTARREYVREDGLSFGVGDESGYAYSATARPATREEMAPAIDACHAEALKIERERSRKLLVGWFRAVGERPSGVRALVGETIPLGTRGRAYGGGSWMVIEPAGERTAPAAEEIDAARADLAARLAALKTASADLIAWTAEHLPADAPTRKCNGGRAPYDGHLYGKDLDSLAAGDRPAYDALLDEEKRLSYTTSPDSHHHAQIRMDALEQAALLASYPRSIWYVENNGSDGSDWSLNNVRTGGAGAIGWRVEWSAEIEQAAQAARE